jgi:hypothetical protein
MWGGALRTGSFAPALVPFGDHSGQGCLLDDDLHPLDHYGRAELSLV